MKDFVVVGGLLFLIFLARLTYSWAFPDPDSALNQDRWGTIARNLVEGQGYIYPYYKDTTGSPHAVTAMRGPIPVFFFAALFWLFGVKIGPVMVANWLLDVGTGFLIYRITKKVFDDKHIACLSVLLFALYVPEMMTTIKAYSEPLYTFLLASFMLSFMLALRTPSVGRFCLSGALLGLATHCRPITLAWPVVILILMLISHPQAKWVLFRDFIVLVLSFAMILLPWIVRNYVVFQAFIPGSTLAGYNLFRDHYRLLDNEGWIREIGPRRVIEAAMGDILAEREDTIEGKSEVELDKLYFEEAMARIKKRPDRYIILCFYRFLRLWFNVGFGAPPSLRSRMMLAVNATFLLLAIASFVWFKGPWIKLSLPVVALVLFFTAVHMAIHALVRYIFPVVPYVLMFAANTTVELMKCIRHIRNPLNCCLN